MEKPSNSYLKDLIWLPHNTIEAAQSKISEIKQHLAEILEANLDLALFLNLDQMLDVFPVFAAEIAEAFSLTLPALKADRHNKHNFIMKALRHCEETGHFPRPSVFLNCIEEGLKFPDKAERQKLFYYLKQLLEDHPRFYSAHLLYADLFPEFEQVIPNHAIRKGVNVKTLKQMKRQEDKQAKLLRWCETQGPQGLINQNGIIPLKALVAYSNQVAPPPHLMDLIALMSVRGADAEKVRMHLSTFESQMEKEDLDLWVDFLSHYLCLLRREIKEDKEKGRDTTELENKRNQLFTHFSNTLERFPEADKAHAMKAITKIRAIYNSKDVAETNTSLLSLEQDIEMDTCHSNPLSYTLRELPEDDDTSEEIIPDTVLYEIIAGVQMATKLDEPLN